MTEAQRKAKFLRFSTPSIAVVGGGQGPKVGEYHAPHRGTPAAPGYDIAHGGIVERSVALDVFR
jgi:hypothetical protein